MPGREQTLRRVYRPPCRTFCSILLTFCAALPRVYVSRCIIISVHKPNRMRFLPETKARKPMKARNFPAEPRGWGCRD